MNNGSKPAHPTGHSQSGTGLTKREYFAAMAMQGLISGSNLSLSKEESDMIAGQAVQFADSLLKQLES